MQLNAIALTAFCVSFKSGSIATSGIEYLRTNSRLKIITLLISLFDFFVFRITLNKTHLLYVH